MTDHISAVILDTRTKVLIGDVPYSVKKSFGGWHKSTPAAEMFDVSMILLDADGNETPLRFLLNRPIEPEPKEESSDK